MYMKCMQCLYVHAGPLNAVRDLLANVRNSVLYITWNAPFTLNLTNTEPDITYCIQIFNNSNKFQLLQTCGHIVTEFIYQLQNNVSLCCASDDCSITVTVAPINGAGNGSSAQVQIPCTYNSIIATIVLDIIMIIPYNNYYFLLQLMMN